MKIECQWCDNEFESKTATALLCPACRAIKDKRKEVPRKRPLMVTYGIVKCEWCGEDFEMIVKGTKRRMCCDECKIRKPWGRREYGTK